MVKPRSSPTSSTSTMAGESDDLMNLGPFIKNYVFNAQPLHNLSLIAKLDQTTTTPTGTGPGAGADQHSCTKRDQKVRENLASPKPDAGDVCRPLHNNGTGQSLPYKKRNWDSSGWSPPKFKNGPKYLSEKQTKIKNWLTANYTYCPRHKNAKVSSRGVLTRVVKEFGPLTQKALGFLMYQAFPGVERMKDTRKGHIFKGIMDKNPKRSRSRKDRSSSPPSRPVSRDTSRDSSRDQDKFDDQEDENEAPMEPAARAHTPTNNNNNQPLLEHDDDHRRVSNYELVEVKMEPTSADYHDDRLNGALYDHGMDLRTKPPVLKQEPEYGLSEPVYDDNRPAVSPVSDDCTPVPLVINYPLLRQSLRHGKHGQFLPGAELYYPAVSTDRTGLDNGTTVFTHHLSQPPHITSTSANSATAGYFKLPQTLPEAHEQLAYLLRYIQAREEKLTHLEKQFHSLTVEFQKMASMLREFHVDQVEFVKKVGYTHGSPCDGNNN